MKHKKTTLKNGLRILTIPMRGTQTATVLVMVGVGSRFESEKEAGLSHFIEHMMFKGTKKRPTSLIITSELDSIGGEFNAFTSKEYTGYYAKVNAKHIEKAMDVVSDMYLNSKLEEKEIEREKGTVLQELNMIEDMPMRNVEDVMEGLLYQKNSLERDIVGNKKSVSSFSQKDFLNYMKRYYVANNTVVCVAGKIDEKKIVGDIKKYFSKMAKGKKPGFQKVLENQKTPQVKIKNKKTDQTHLSLGVRAFDYYHKDRFILSVLATILGGNMSSRMFIEVRERKGLAYFIKTSIETFADCGYLTTQAGVEHKNIELTIKTVLNEYKKIASRLVGAEELKKAKEYLKGKAVMSLESSDEVAMFLIDQEIKNKKVMEIGDIFKRIDAVNQEDILRVAKNIFQSEKLNLAVIGPHKNIKQLESIVKF